MGTFDDELMGIVEVGENTFKLTSLSKTIAKRDVGTALIFPDDMKEGFYPEAIKFSIFERHGVSYEKTKDIIKRGAKELYNFQQADYALSHAKRGQKKAEEAPPTPETFEAFEEARRAANTAEDQLDGARTKLFGSKGEKFIGPVREQGFVSEIGAELSKLNDLNTFEKTLDRHLQSIYLAMPESVNFAEGIDWQGTDLGVIGGLKSGALGWNEKSIDYGILAGGGAALGGAGGLAASLIPGISGIAGTVVGAVLGGSGLQSGIESTFGVKANPFKEQTFQGVGFRPFDFSFNFRARSDTDVKLIRDIIRAFRAYSKPTFKEGSDGSIFKYPKEFLIEFLTLDKNNDYATNKHIPQIKFCICTAINTNFTAQGWKSFEGGAPVDISLQLTFQETEIITGEDVAGNTQVGRFAGEERRF